MIWATIPVLKRRFYELYVIMWVINFILLFDYNFFSFWNFAFIAKLMIFATHVVFFLLFEFWVIINCILKPSFLIYHDWTLKSFFFFFFFWQHEPNYQMLYHFVLDVCWKPSFNYYYFIISIQTTLTSIDASRQSRR